VRAHRGHGSTPEVHDETTRRGGGSISHAARTTASRRRPAATALATALLALACAVAAPAAAPAARARKADDAGACTSGRTVPAGAADADRSERALICLLNRERVREGLPALRVNRCLARAADGHARDMVEHRYFDHTSRDGRRFDERILATGYAPPPARWTVGENLAWGGDPAWVVGAWMRSSGHRANVLSARFREIGVAAVPGAPVPRADGAPPRATYAAEFGARSGAGRSCR
jgi:uncharacterized protein YkwD